MAARTLRPRHQDEIRTKIQVSQLLNRLSDCALKDLELRPDQLKSIELLLKKALPDLSAMELSGNVTMSLIDAIRLAGTDRGG